MKRGTRRWAGQLWRLRRLRPPRRLLPAVLITTCLLTASGGWLALTAWQAHGQLTAAVPLARDLGHQLIAGETERARASLTALQARTGAARAATDDPIWHVGGYLPRGGNLTAVREIALVTDELARRVFPTLVELDLTVLVPVDGRLRLGELRAVGARLATVDATVAQVRDRFAAVSTDGLREPIRRAVRELRAELTRLAALTDAVHRAAILLPPLLGADGARTYLMAFQNPAELRATGGMLGAYVAIRVVDGQLDIVDQGSATDLKAYRRPVLPLSKEMRGLYNDLPGLFPADVNLTPHFPTAALLYREMYRRQSGRVVDGVLVTDPVALSYLLRAIGPVPVPGFPTLSAATVVRGLLSDPYLRMEPDEQDRLFAVSAEAVFRALLTRPAEPRALAMAIRDAMAERRLLLWSAREDEQARLVDTALGGVLPEREETPTVGVFLNDGSGAKLGYYLTNRAELAVGACRPDGRRHLRLRVTIASSAPRSGLTSSVLGLGLAGDPYTARTLAYVFSPAGGAVSKVRVDGVDTPIGSGVERGRRVGIVGVDVPPGGSRLIEVDLLTAVTTSGDARLWLTPGAHPWTTRISSAPTCDQ